MLNSRKYYSEIPVLYFIATVFVTMLHIKQYSSLHENKALIAVSNIEASAVPLFLCIAGFLAYNRKKVQEPRKWLWRKLKRIYIPYIIIMLPVMIMYTVCGGVPLYKWIVLLLALQGTQNFLIVNFDFYIAPPGLAHFWYVTIILICFAITAIIEWEKLKRQNGNTLGQPFQEQPIVTESRLTSRVYLLLIAAIAAQFLLVYVHLTAVYVMAFFVGYTLAKSEFRFNTKNLLFLTAFAFVSLAVCVVAQRFVDASILYDLAIAPIQTMLVGIWIFAVVFWLHEKKPSLIDKISTNPIIKFTSGCVFEIYLIHSITLASKINVFTLFNNEFLAIVISLVITLVAAYIVNKIARYLSGIKIAH